MQSLSNVIPFIQAAERALRFDYITDVVRKRAHLNTIIAFVNISNAANKIKSNKTARKCITKEKINATNPTIGLSESVSKGSAK